MAVTVFVPVLMFHRMAVNMAVSMIVIIDFLFVVHRQARFL